LKGTLRVVIEGVTSRITITLAASEGINFAADLDVMIAATIVKMRNRRKG